MAATLNVRLSIPMGSLERELVWSRNDVMIPTPLTVATPLKPPGLPALPTVVEPSTAPFAPSALSVAVELAASGKVQTSILTESTGTVNVAKMLNVS